MSQNTADMEAIADLKQASAERRERMFGTCQKATLKECEILRQNAEKIRTSSPTKGELNGS